MAEEDGEGVAMATAVGGLNRKAGEIAGSLYESFGGTLDLKTIVEAVDLELARYVHVPIKDFVPVLVERDVRARLRELRAG